MAESTVFGLNLRYYVAGAEEPLALQQLTAAFERAGDNFQRYGEFVFPRLIPVLEKSAAAQIAAGGRGPNAGRFRRLSPAYAQWKLRHYPGRPILVRTGKMLDALTRSESGVALRYFNRRELIFGSQGLEYAGFHQTGTLQMPARPPFDFGQDFADEVQREAALAARDCAREARLDRLANLEGFGA